MTNRVRLAAAVALSAFVGITSGGRADDATPASTSQEIQALRTRLDQLEAQQKEADRARREAEAKLDDKIASDELAKDSERRDQFLTAEGFTAGYTDGRFVIQDDAGNFVLRPFLHLQFRGVVNDRQDAQGPAKHPYDEVDAGFEVRRMKFGFDGNAFTPDLEYDFVWASQRTSQNVNVTSTTGTTKGTTIGTVSNSLGGVPLLEEAWVKYHIPTTPFSLKAGQIKDPVLHDQMVRTRSQLSTERSLTADIFVNGDGYTEGATFIYDPNASFRTEVGINHGMRSADTNFLSYPNNGTLNQFDYGVVGRAEYKAFGRWDDYTQVMGAQGVKEDVLVFGVGTDYSERGHDGQVVTALDAAYSSPTGLSVYGAFVNRYTTHNFGYFTQGIQGANITAGNPAIAGKATDEYSVMAQVGYVINQQYEPFGRWEYISLEGMPVGSKNHINALAAGVNDYIYGRKLKLTGEVLYLPQGLPFNDTATDELANTNGRTELVYEVQLELVL